MQLHDLKSVHAYIHTYIHTYMQVGADQQEEEQIQEANLISGPDDELPDKQEKVNAYMHTDMMLHIYTFLSLDSITMSCQISKRTYIHIDIIIYIYIYIYIYI
jgi:hypothetical protein